MTHGGNVRIMTVMGDARMDGLSDAGSTPARSTNMITALCMEMNIHGAVIFVLRYARKADCVRFCEEMTGSRMPIRCTKITYQK